MFILDKQKQLLTDSHFKEQMKPAVRWGFFFLSLVLLQDFVISLSIILRGSITDKLNWAFNLYDLNKDGCITREVTTTPALASFILIRVL